MSEPQLDIEQADALTAYLLARGWLADREALSEIEVLAGGVSNRTVKVVRSDGASIVIKQALAKLRVAVDWYSDPQRIHREALGLRWLQTLAPADVIPKLVFEDFDHHLLAMETVPAPHDNWKELLLAGGLQSDHVTQFALLLGTIHRQASVHRAEIEPLFGDRTFFESLRLEPYYSYSAQNVSAAARFIADLSAATRACRQTLVHGDYSPKNVLVQQNKLILLDHEVIHFGDPGFDLGFALTHLLSKGHHLAAQRALFAQAAEGFWRIYRDTIDSVSWAAQVESRAVRHTIACLLARVAGRSPLEYLNETQRQAQRAAAISLMTEVPRGIVELVQTFYDRIEAH